MLKPSSKKVIGFTCGAFDLYHPGHAMMLKEAKSKCDYLIVGVQTDPSIDRPDTKHKPIQTLKERLTVLESVKYINEIYVYTTEAVLYKRLQKSDIGIRIIGADWEGKKYTGYDLRVPMYFNSRDHDYSTSELRQRIKDA